MCPPRSLPRLTDGSLVLAAPRLDDAVAWSAAQDDECAHGFDWPCPPGVERCRAYLERVVDNPEPDEYVWAIREAGLFVGGIDLKRDATRWNVSYFVTPARRRRGIASRALRLVVGFATTELGVAEVSTRVHVDNVASRRTLARVGFDETGVVANGEHGHDDALYSYRRQ